MYLSLRYLRERIKEFRCIEDKIVDNSQCLFVANRLELRVIDLAFLITCDTIIGYA